MLHGDDVWAVAPRYLHGVSMADAERHADLHGCELPSRELVDAIWRAADCKLAPMPRAPRADMVSEEVIGLQRDRLLAQELDWIAEHAAEPRLIAGTHKDVVRTAGGRLAIYGWHQLDGSVIQPVSSIHRLDYRDYSQGARLVCRVESLADAA